MPGWPPTCCDGFAPSARRPARRPAWGLGMTATRGKAAARQATSSPRSRRDDGRDLASILDEPVDLSAAPRRAPSPTGWLRPGCTSSRRSSARRHRPGRSRMPRTTSWLAPAPTRPVAPPRSPSCASRTGSAGRSTTCGASGPPSPSRSWPRSSSSTSDSCPMLRAAGADLVLLLAVLHDAEALRAAGRQRPGHRPRAAGGGTRRGRDRCRRRRAGLD